MKTKETIALENALMRDTIKYRKFGVPEVTIGWYGNRRVDFMSTTTKGLIRCYEIKVTESDFHSKNGHNFDGNFNYYVMPEELWEQVKDEIPEHVGVLVGTDLKSVKKCKFKELPDSEREKMILYLCRSLSREVKKSYRSKSKAVLARLERENDNLKRMNHSYARDIRDLNNELRKIKRRLEV